MLELLQIRTHDVMLQLEIVLLALVEAPEDVDLPRGFEAARPHAAGDAVFAGDVGPSEDGGFEAAAAVVEVGEDGGLVGLVHEFEEEGLQKVVPAGPEQEQVGLSLVVVPVGQNADLALPIHHALLALENDRHRQALLLLEVFLVHRHAVPQVHLRVVVFEAVLRRPVRQVVHYEHWHSLALAAHLVRFVQHFRRFVQL